MHLEIGHPQGHHNVGCRMGLGEHVLDLSTGLDVPLWHIVFLHGCDIAIALFFRNFQPKALPHALHNRKGHLRLQALVHEVNHDIIPTADNGGQVSNPLLDQVLSIAQPNVRTMRETR